ncbi:MAG: hypothetical protein PHG67_03465 [Bacteroidales bacterium]|nr:hypothetical protein [Bacteroidales bacterium]
MRLILKVFICFLVYVITLPTLKAQSGSGGFEQPIPGWEFGVQMGFGQYYGDISKKNFFQKFSGETRFSGQLIARRHFNERYGLGFSLQRSGLHSVKDNFLNGTAADLEYNGRVFELGIHGFLNMSNLFWGGNNNHRVNLYGTLALHYGDWKGTLRNSQTQNIIVENSSNNTGTKYKSGSMIIPVALGLKFALSDNLWLDFNSSIHTVLSDDLDYYADGFKHDILFFTHIGVAYHLGSGSGNKKPKPVRSGISTVGPVEVTEYDRYESKRSEKQETVQPTVIPVLDLEPVQKSKTFEFRVQVLAKREQVEHISRIFPNVVFDFPIVVNKHQGIYRYSTGSFSSFEAAENYANVMRNKGIHDAFVVAYQNDIRIPITPEMKN